MADYDLWLSTDTGTHLVSLNTTLGFSYTRVVNNIGAFTILLPESFDRRLLRVDRRVEFWRAVEGGHPGLDFLGFIRGWTFETDANGQTTIIVQGVCPMDLVRRRIIAYAAGTAQAQMSDQADDMIKAVVTDNLGADAAAGRIMTAYSFSVQGDLAAGPSMDKAFAWRNLLTVCQDIAAAAWGLGTLVFFDVVPTSTTALQFQTWTGQRGRDHSYPDGSPPVLFGLEFGNLEQPSLTYDYSSEVNYVYGLGQGEGSDRVTAEVSDMARIGASVWNRCEAAQDARNEAVAGAVEDAAYQRLVEGRPVIRFSGQLRDTPGTRYGRDWQFGDKVTATYLGQQFDGIVRAVTVSVDGDNKEAVDARLEVIT